jgi:hypothetical protein
MSAFCLILRKLTSFILIQAVFPHFLYFNLGCKHIQELKNTKFPQWKILTILLALNLNVWNGTYDCCDPHGISLTGNAVLLF